jgi:hypothetical protein
MAATAVTPLREHERPMSWARAVVIASGFFFITAILAGQLPSYIYTVSTLSTLERFEQGFLDLALLAIGFGVIALEVAFLYDPKPLLPWPLFALAGAAATVVGLFFCYQVAVGLGSTGFFGPGWVGTLPAPIRGGFWPTGTSYLFHPAWFQINSISLSGLGMIAIVIGLGMFTIAALNPLVLSGRLMGPLRDLLVRFSVGLAFIIMALFLTIFTFIPQAFQSASDTRHGPIWNVLLFIALLLAMFGLIVWLLPVMVANRQRFMPAVYLHGVVGLIGFVGIPLLILWAIIYPVVNLIHNADPTQFLVICGSKFNVPGSCSFSGFSGYIIAAIAFTTIFGLLVAGLFFWTTRRDTVILGGTIAMLFLALGATIIHVDDPVQLPLGLVLAISIAIVAFAWTWATQREFAPTTVQPLGCTGQWLVLGTLLLIYLFGFAVFSLPSFFEIEALALFYTPGAHLLHDAFWALLLLGGLAAFQMTLLIRRRPMSNLRKFAMWTLLVAVALQMVGAIQGFHRNVLDLGIDAMEGGHAVFLAGIIFELVGVLICLYGAYRAQSRPWMIAILAVVLVSAGFGVVMYSISPPVPELVVWAFILASVGAFAYVAAGPDEEDLYAVEANGNGASSFVVTR